MDHKIEEEPGTGYTGIKSEIDMISEEMLYADHETKVLEVDLLTAVRGSEPKKPISNGLFVILLQFFKDLSCEADVGLKLMGDLNIKPFEVACKHKYHDDVADDKAVELCSLWDGRMATLKIQWHPFKIVFVNGKDQEIVDADDTELKCLKNEFGNEVYDAVATALLELNEYNASGGYPVQELWNFKENRKATAKGAMFILDKWKKKKRK